MSELPMPAGARGSRATEPLGHGLEEPPDRNGAFPRLDEDQRSRLRAVGKVRRVASGEVLIREGVAGYDFFVVETGAIAIVQGYDRENRVIFIHGPHRFAGEVSLMTGSPAVLSAVVRDAGEVIQVSAASLSELLAADEELSNVILRAFMSRRELLIDIGRGVKVVGSRYSLDARRVREFLARNRMPYQWLDVEDDRDAEALLRALGIVPAETPVLIGGLGVLRNPSNARIARFLGFGSKAAPRTTCDLVIVGAGPAGLAAAVYGASEGLETQVIDAVAFGGQASTSSRIENYLGFPTGISGGELAERATLQARRFGARMVVPAEGVALQSEHGQYGIELADGSTVRGRTVIVATGARYRQLDLPELERYDGLGVYHAATRAEASRCTGDSVVIVGGGNSAGQAAMFLSQYASSCRLLIRAGDLGKSMSRYLVDEIERRERVEVLAYSEVVELRGEMSLEAVVVADTRSGKRVELESTALFVFIGASPHTEWLRGHVAMDEHGFLLTGRDARNDLPAATSELPFLLETSARGVFAVGDVHSGSIKRVASAVGEGSMAVRLVHQRLADSAKPHYASMR